MSDIRWMSMGSQTMDTVITILENIIDEQGAQYLQRSPYAVYQKLISEKTRPDYARLVLITLLCNASVKAGEMDAAELSNDLQKGCFLRKKAADEIASMYKRLFSEENVSSSGDMSDFEPDDMRW